MRFNKRFFFSSGFIVLVFAFTALTVLAGYHDNPDPLPGWTHAPLSGDDSPDRHGIQLGGGPIERGSPVIAEIDGNTANGKEVAVGGSDGYLYVYQSNGQLLWYQKLNGIHSKPAVGELFGNDVPYVVVSYGSVDRPYEDGGIAVYDGRNGSPVWGFSLQQFWASIGSSSPSGAYTVLASPSLADTDGDGFMEIGFTAWDQIVYMLNADGTLRWYYAAADTSWSSPAFTNIDNDPQLEMIVATDMSASAYTQEGGYVYAFDTHPRNPPGIAFGSGALWATHFDQALYSSPAIGDVFPSSPGDEIVIGSGCHFPTSSYDKRGKWVAILRPSDGAVLQVLNAPFCVESSPALGDINDDGYLEVVATVNGSNYVGGDGYSRVVAWQPTVSTAPMWSAIPYNVDGSNDPSGGHIQSAVIADLDGNGSLEVIAANQWSVVVLDGRTGEQLTCGSNACGPQTSLFAWYTLKSTPAVGDINSDGKLDVVIGGSHSSLGGAYGMLYAWTNFAESLNSSPGYQTPYSAPWPMFRGDAQNSGNMGGGNTPPPSRAKISDFNGDGYSDILKQNNMGQTYMHLMQGGSIIDQGYVAEDQTDAAWNVAGTGDYNGDGYADVLWRHNNGQTYVFFMNGKTVTSVQAVGQAIDLAWHIVESGDYNGDGSSDILWWHEGGTTYLFLMQGNQIIDHGTITTIDPSWHIVDSGDYNGDGYADILWQNQSSGEVYIYMMHGKTVASYGYVTTIDPSWRIVGSGDYNGDGSSDILWQHSSGTSYIYLMSGATVIGAAQVQPAHDASWQIVGSGDYNGDGYSDILWRNTVSGMALVYFMNGTTTSSSATILNSDDPAWEFFSRASTTFMDAVMSTAADSTTQPESTPLSALQEGDGEEATREPPPIITEGAEEMPFPEGQEATLYLPQVMTQR